MLADKVTAVSQQHWSRLRRDKSLAARTNISSHLSSQRFLRSRRFWRLRHGLLSRNVRAIRRLRLPERFTGLTSGKCT